MNVKVKTKQQPLVKATEPVNVEHVDLATVKIEELADMYGTLNARVATLKADPAFAHFALVCEELKKRLEDYEPQDVVKVTGKLWLVEAGACAKAPRTVIDVLSVMRYVGDEKFAAVAKVNFSDAEALLTPEQLSDVADENPGYTDNRRITQKYLGKAKA